MADVRVKIKVINIVPDVVSILLGERNISTPITTDVPFQSLYYIYIYIILMNLYFTGNVEQGKITN